MLAIDTNIVVRFLRRDDPEQAARATALIMAEQVLLLSTVVLEVEWVLRSGYRLDRAAVCDAIGAFASLPSVTLEDPVRVRAALALASQGMDLADALHVAAADGCDGFVTFDKALIRKAVEADVRVALREP